MFEPFTGFLGSGSDTIPKQVSGFTVGAAAGRDGGGRLVERYWIGATDSGDQAVEPQMVAETYGFKQFSLLCAAIFDRCGRLAETKVGFGFTAHRNRLSRLIDPSLPSCTGRGRAVHCHRLRGGRRAGQVFSRRRQSRGCHGPARMPGPVSGARAGGRLPGPRGLADRAQGGGAGGRGGAQGSAPAGMVRQQARCPATRRSGCRCRPGVFLAIAASMTFP